MPPAACKAEADAPLPFFVVAGGVRVRLKVTPRARRPGIDGLFTDADGSVRLKVGVTAAAAEGRANAAVLALLADAWRVPRSALTVQAGAAARRKTVGIDGDARTVMTLLHDWYAASGLPHAEQA